MAAESVYKVIELVGTSKESWEKAATNAIERASRSLRDLTAATRRARVASLGAQMLDERGEHELRIADQRMRGAVVGGDYGLACGKG